MTIEIKGTVKEMFATKVVSDKFQQREIAVTIEEGRKYPQHISVMANNDKIELLDSVEVGDSVTIVANVNGRLWTDKEGNNKYFNTLTIFKLNVDKF